MHMRSRHVAFLSCLAVFAGCVSSEPDQPEQPEQTEQPTDPADPTDPAAPVDVQASGTLQLNLLYIHGVQSEAGGRSRAERSLNDLRSSLAADLPALIASYQASHPGVTVTVASASANLYTATPSGIHPSDSTDPILMDDWEVGDPGCTTTRQGDPCTTAYEWRFRLVQEIRRLFPPTAKNIILVGHSTGARTAFEVASNTGPDGVGTFDWGVQDRIAAVVSINGMIDGLQSDKYNSVGPFSFVTTCKNGDAILSVFGGSTPGNGWCEYAGNVSGVAAADWVGQHKRSRVLISTASCSPSLWTGNSDGSLPLAAAGSPFSVGLNMTPAAGQTFTVAYGHNYGEFCHSTITSGGDANHAKAVASAKAQIVDLIFTAATRVDQQGTVSTAGAIAFRGSTPAFAVGGACPAGDVGVKPQVQVVGVCRHPGFFDGDDHAISDGFAVSNGAACNGTFTWSQVHDSSNSHAATFYWQTRSNPVGGGLLSILPPN
jgi:pimeloyl-ACP methyl ester carboxylesterase